MAKRLRRDPARQFLYEIAVSDWQAEASFNDYAYINIFDQDQFEETIRLELTGVISYCSTTKLKRGGDPPPIKESKSNSVIAIHNLAFIKRKLWAEKHTPRSRLSGNCVKSK